MPTQRNHPLFFRRPMDSPLTEDIIAWKHEAGFEYLYLEMHDRPAEEALETNRRFLGIIGERADASVHLIINMNYLKRYVPKVALEWQRSQRLLEAKCSHAAIYGANSVVGVAITVFLNIAKFFGMELSHRVQCFRDEERAVEWLARGSAILRR